MFASIKEMNYRYLGLTMGKSIQDYEKFEEERSDFIKDRLLKYVDTCVGVDERSAQVCFYNNFVHYVPNSNLLFCGYEVIMMKSMV